MYTSKFTYKDQLTKSASFLLSRQNPNDFGWGLNIEKGFQASSIVNTAEALFVINQSGVELESKTETINYLKKAIEGHPKERGNNLRYRTFGVLGLLEAGLPLDDPFILKTVKEIENRLIGNTGWSDDIDDKNVRLWPSFQSLWILSRVKGCDYVSTKFHSCLSHLLTQGKANGYNWGFEDKSKPQLTATSYALILLSLFYPGSHHTSEACKQVILMLNEALDYHNFLEVEPVHGTDWHHYGYCWAIKGIQLANDCFNETTYMTTAKALRAISTFYSDGKGFVEPGKNICNVRSIFNNVLAINAVVRNFDPAQYLIIEKIIRMNMNDVIANSIFLSFSYRKEDKELVEGFEKLLKAFKFHVITGEKNPIGSLSKNIIKKIKSAEKFVIIMTCRDKKENDKYTTSSWLLEEKGVALAIQKPCLMLIEQGIDEGDIGGLQGDDQRLYFNRNNFASVIFDAIQMLKD